ncbi:unnamed protein product, partial [marine sediment metagenome]
QTCDLVNEHEIDGEDKLASQLLLSYQNKFKFLYKDLLKVRKLKILNAALILQEIDINNLLEAEKFLYQNTVSSVKGYKKLKKVSSFDEKEEVIEKIVDTQTIAEIKLIDDNSNVISEKIDGIKSEDMPHEVIKTEGIKYEAIKNEDINYTLIRFIKGVPPLVGIDLTNYGPFEKEDIANIPIENAKILINEKCAEVIDISEK